MGRATGAEFILIGLGRLRGGIELVELAMLADGRGSVRWGGQ